MTEIDRLDSILRQVLDVPDEAREAFLDETCGQHTQLRAIVEEMLQASEAEDSPLIPGGALSGPLWNELARNGISAGLETGDRVGAYRVVRALGQGGMATVYLAERADGQFEQAVALKVLHDSRYADDVARRFGQERQILASLNHPHIAHLVDGGLLPSGPPYVALEYVEGLPIDQYCDRDNLDVDERLRLFMQVAGAVGHAHRNLVIHRDIKPSNILVTRDGVPKLLDFGIAKLLDDSLPHAAPETRSALHPMTPEYASPEQVRGEPLTTASDIYQLGYLLYRLLTGASPYRAERGNYAAAIEAICRHDAIPPSRAVPDEHPGTLAADLDTIVLKALRKEPAERYHSAEALAGDIDRYLQGQPVAARQGSAAYRARKFVRRHLWGVGASLAFVLLVAGFGGAYTIQAANNAVQLAAERDAARLEAAKALEVTDFLIGLFEASDPREAGAGAGTATAREILARGVARIDALEAQPQVQAEMLDVLGQVYHRLGQYDDAQRLLERAVSAWRSVPGGAGTELAASLTQLGRVLDTRGEYDRALAMHREALALQREVYDGDNVELARTLDNLGETLSITGQYAAAEQAYREALSMLRALLGDEHPLVATTLSNLGLLLTRTGDYDEAEALHREALAMRRKLLGNEHLDLTYSLNNLALVLHKRGDYAAAEPLYRELLALDRKLLGREHPEIAMDLNNLAGVMADQGRYDEALAMQREALAIRRKTLRDQHPLIAQSLNNMAVLYFSTGDRARAEPAFREALAIRRAVFGEQHPEVANVLANLGLLLSAKGDTAAAEPLLREALTIRRAVLGDEHPDVARSLYRLAGLSAADGEPQAAESLYREAIAIQSGATGPRHPMTAVYRSALAECLTVQGRFEEAEPLLLEAYAVLRAERGDEHRQTAQVRERLAALYEAAGEPDKAAGYRLAAEAAEAR